MDVSLMIVLGCYLGLLIGYVLMSLARVQWEKNANEWQRRAEEAEALIAEYRKEL